MLKLELTCAMCGGEKLIAVEVDRADDKIDTAKAVKAAGWRSERNGENFDIYCSARCAK